MTEPPIRPLDVEAAAEASDPVRGRLLAGRYRVTDLVARGGMARIYRAHDERLDRDVALKVLSRPYADDRAYVERFLSEARNAASISHPNLVHVYDSGSDGALHYIAMELLASHRSLRDLIRAGGPLPPPRATQIAIDVLTGLRAAHARNLLHCDVKSGNVMVHDGSTKLIDFGIARSRNDERPQGSSIGSLHYMAPEQLLGQALSPATDLYSVGVVLYEALTGRLPYHGATPDEVAAAHMAGQPVPPRELNAALSSALESVILQALRRDPERRFPSADAMIDALRGATAFDDRTQPIRPVAAPAPRPAERPSPAPPAQPGPQARRGPAPSVPAVPPAAAPRPARRRGIPWGAIALVVAVLGLAGIAWAGLGAFPQLFSGTPGPSGPGATVAQSRPPLPDGQVYVPAVVGLSEDAAIEAASQARLDWTLHYRTDPSTPVGVYAQDIEPGTVVEVGTEFNFYSNRHP